MKFSDRRKTRILEQARALLASPPPLYVPPLERREWQLPLEPEFEPPPRGLDTAPPAPAPAIDRAAIDAMIERRVAAAISVAHANLMAAAEAIATEVVAIRDSIEDRVSNETRELKVEMTALSAALSDLRSMLALERERARTVAEMMPLPASRRSDLN
jgi:hypothetical protein